MIRLIDTPAQLYQVYTPTIHTKLEVTAATLEIFLKLRDTLTTALPMDTPATQLVDTRITAQTIIPGIQQVGTTICTVRDRAM